MAMNDLMLELLKDSQRRANKGDKWEKKFLKSNIAKELYTSIYPKHNKRQENINTKMDRFSKSYIAKPNRSRNHEETYQ